MIYKILAIVYVVTVMLFLFSVIYDISVPFPNKYTDGLVKWLLYAVVIESGVFTILFLFFGV
jgi:multisubunit Na+/H+ antiporter MnhB subunit